MINKDDPRAHSPETKKAIHSEVHDLARRGTVTLIPKSELPNGANAVTARFVLAIKSDADGKVKYKARYAIGGQRNNLQH